MKTTYLIFALSLGLISFGFTSCVIVAARHEIVIKKDNGLHRGWYKSPQNLHHPSNKHRGYKKK